MCKKGGFLMDKLDIIAKLNDNCNIYHRLILLIKLDTQVYYNIRMALGLETLYEGK